MTIKISARNFRRLVKADIECSPIALVAGRNSAAKTSLLQAVGGALSRDNLLKRLDVTTKNAHHLVHDGAEKATVEIVTEQGVVALDWPDGQPITKGEAPRASIFATGLASIATMSAKERATILEPYLKSLPNREDIEACFREEESGDEELSAKFLPPRGWVLSEKEEWSHEDSNHEPTIEEQYAVYFWNLAVDIWRRIERDGWDRVHTDLVNRRRETAAEWEQVTHENWGSQKAQDWKPQGWRPALDEVTKEQLEVELAAQLQKLEDAISQRAIANDQLEQLQRLAAEAPAREEVAQAALVKHRIAKAAQEEAAATRAALPDLPTGVPVSCPHPECQRPIAVIKKGAATTLEIFKTPPEADLRRIREAIAGADGALSRTNTEFEAADKALREAKAAFAEALQAQEKIDGAAGRTVSAEAVEIAREHAHYARESLKTWQTMQQARTLAACWRRVDTAVKILAPTGVRQKKLAQAIEDFNTKVLAPLSKLTVIAGPCVPWPVVAIDPGELNVTCDGRPYGLMGESDQLKTRTILQLAMARIDGSLMVIVDRADMLDQYGRNQLFLGLLQTLEIPALVAMTITGPDRVPDLAGAGFGASYWLDDGVLLPIAEAKAAVAQAAA